MSLLKSDPKLALKKHVELLTTGDGMNPIQEFPDRTGITCVAFVMAGVPVCWDCITGVCSKSPAQ